MKKNPDMVTAFGHEVYYDKPELLIVDPEDLRVHSSNICRYSGAINWKLIKHLALVVKLCDIYYYGDPLVKAYAAVHDLHEVYCTDVVSGLKKYLSTYQEIEDSFEAHVHEQLGLRWETKPTDCVHLVDRRALIIEMTYFNHPGLEAALEKFKGGPYYGEATLDEMKMISIVDRMSPNKCWDFVWRTIVKGREAEQVLKEIRQENTWE